MKSFFAFAVVVIAVVVASAFAVVVSPPAAAALQQLASPGPLTARHAWLKGRCTTCHEPAVGVTVAKCTACHANAERLLGRQPTAFHVSIQECTPCHVEHQGDSLRPLVMDHVTLATIGARTLLRAAHHENGTGNDADSAATLASLQTWLRVRSPEQLDAASARESLDCAGCHDRRDPHFKRFGVDCAQCHALESWRIVGYRHPSPRSKECVQCHLAPPSHFMGHFAMVSQERAGKTASVEQCFECHHTTSWNDIVDVGFYKRH